MIEKFGEQMAPYAVEVVSALAGHFMRLLDSADNGDDGGDDVTPEHMHRCDTQKGRHTHRGEIAWSNVVTPCRYAAGDDDAALAAMGIVQAISTMMQARRDLFPQDGDGP